MTRWRDTNQEVDRSVEIQPLLGIYCSAMDTSSAFNTCEYFNIILCMPLIWEPLWFLCIWGCKANEISSAQTTLTIPVVYIRAACWVVICPNVFQTRLCQYTGIPLDRPEWKTTGATSTLGCHWNHTGCGLHPEVSQWRSRVNLHNWDALEHHWKASGRPLE